MGSQSQDQNLQSQRARIGQQPGNEESNEQRNDAGTGPVPSRSNERDNVKQGASPDLEDDDGALDDEGYASDGHQGQRPMEHQKPRN